MVIPPIAITVAYGVTSLATALAAVVAIVGRGRALVWAGRVGMMGLMALALLTFDTAKGWSGAYDFAAFHELGRETLAGRDPVAGLASSPLPALNPPTSYPLFAAFALGPQSVTFALWTAANALLAATLVPLSWRGLKVVDVATRSLPRAALLALAACVALSNSVRGCLSSGQLGILEAVALIAALSDRAEGRPIRAGAWLALATVKIGTMVPFLLLFHRRSDRTAWASMIVVTAALCLTTGRAADTPERVGQWLAAIGRMSRVGAVNDFTYAAPDNADMIGLDHAFYRAGLKSPGSAKLAQGLVLLVLGVYVAWEVIARSTFSEGAKWSQVSLFSMLFLYHRVTDAMILAIPLVYVTARARATSGRARALFAATAIVILPILLMPRRGMKTLRDIAEGGGLTGQLVETFVSPYACWLLLIAMLLLGLAEDRSRLDERIGGMRA